MVNKLVILLLAFTYLFLTACTAVKPTVTNQYKLAAFSNNHYGNQHSRASVLVTLPEAIAEYQTEQMFYMIKPFEINAFAHNAWVEPPAEMLFPLILQSLQHTGYFYAVASSPTSEKTDYRVDTQLLELEQNFLQKPSTLHFIVKVVLTHVSDGRVIASRDVNLQIPCPSETPYGGVLAANKATMIFTAQLTAFVVDNIKKDYSKQ